MFLCAGSQRFYPVGGRPISGSVYKTGRGAIDSL